MVSIAAPVGPAGIAAKPFVKLSMLRDEIAVQTDDGVRLFSHDGLEYKGRVSGDLDLNASGGPVEFSVPAGTSVWGNGLYVQAIPDYFVVSLPELHVLFKSDGLAFADFEWVEPSPDWPLPTC